MNFVTVLTPLNHYKTNVMLQKNTPVPGRMEFHTKNEKNRYLRFLGTFFICGTIATLAIFVCALFRLI
ncbi:hypothetical protein NIASO_16070 [Niabella soli DSM 19437]|uniref:Uncharacterized protein n=1 Tax=Niabella soli DSM 19437 TaxID=929713 RepID=W0F8U1_9BACT|nr:hypothetical protein NIASO_16070 [Niabella soli DSM 19437]